MKYQILKDVQHAERMLKDIHNKVTICYFTEKAQCRHCKREEEMLNELAGLSHKIYLEIYNFSVDEEEANKYGIDKVPAVALLGLKDYGIRYYGMPSDFEFDVLLEDILRVSSGKSALMNETKEKLKGLHSPLHLEIITTPNCPFSVQVVRLAHEMAIESDMITADLVNIDDFPVMAERYQILASPTVVVNGSYHFYGPLKEPDFVDEALKVTQG